MNKLLSELIEDVDVVEIYGKKDMKISEIVDNSKSALRGCVFVAIKGTKNDGHNYIETAISKGAVAIIGEQNPKKSWIRKTSYVKVRNSREALSLLASVWYGHPSKSIKLIGITGSDGKTTTSYLVYEILKKSGKKAGLVTSVSAKIGSKEIDTGFHVTNPEPLQLQELLSRMVKEGAQYAVLEVTSHGLDQDRVAGLIFDVGILTNITHEHLDYHKTFENYRDAKLKLFKVSKTIVLNKDDPSFEYISNKSDKRSQTVSYSIKEDANYYAYDISYNGITKFKVKEGPGVYGIKATLGGDFNVSNMLAAIGAAREAGVSWEHIKKALSTFEEPEGRLTKIKNNRGMDIYVDFAHTPNSITEVLKYLRTISKGRLIAVFGCAGERDVVKRPMMGEISTRLADVSIFTAEDPREEDVHKIIDQMAEGALKSQAAEVRPHEDVESANGRCYLRIPDRNEAIIYALTELAVKGDTVVFCGKGHEKSMAYEGVEHPWSEKDAISEALNLDDKKTAIILAAGKGTRMKSAKPKVIHKIAGRPMISYTLRNLRRAGFGNIVVVVGYKRDLVIRETCGRVRFAAQEEQLGTGHSFAHGISVVSDDTKNVLVVNGDDSAFYNPKTLNNMYEGNKGVVSFATAIFEDPAGLGRVIRDSKGKVINIVEEKEANQKEKKVKEINIALYVFNVDWAKRNVGRIRESKVGEYYIVDLIGMAVKQKEHVKTYQLKNKAEWVGVNTKNELSKADRQMLKSSRKAFKGN